MTIDEYRAAVRAFYCQACQVDPGEHCRNIEDPTSDRHEIDTVHDVRTFAYFLRDGDAPEPQPPVMVPRLPDVVDLES